MAQKNQNWDDLGQTIERIIDRAVNNQDFSRLNQSVTQTIEKAMDKGGEAFRKAVNAGSGRRKTADPVAVSRPKPEVLYGKTGTITAAGILKIMGGSLLLVGTFGIFLSSLVIQAVFSAGEFLNASWIPALLGWGGGAALLGSGIGNLNRVKRFKAYCKVLGDRTSCTLESLGRQVGKGEKFVRREVQKMIQNGLFLQGHLDKEQTRLITTHETYRIFEENRLLLQQRQQREAQEKARRAAAVTSPSVREVLDRGDRFLEEIRRCNDAIAGYEISRKISGIEDIVERIFDRAETHPEIVPELKKTMDYYLPMTVKLLKAYADMDAQPVQGETIQNAKKEIENTLDTLNIAFENLLDSFFADTALDISSDISVLQTLLAQDGLTGNGVKL